MHQTDRQFLAYIVQVKNRTKTPVTECFVPSVCVLFSLAKSMQRMGTCVCFFAITYYCFTRHNYFFCQEDISYFYCKLLPSSEIAKAEAIAVGLVKRKRSDFFSPS